MVRLNDLSLQLEQFLETQSMPSSAEVLQLQIFEIELALGHFMDVVREMIAEGNVNSETYLKIARITEVLAACVDTQEAVDSITRRIRAQLSLSEHSLSDESKLEKAALSLVQSIRHPEWTEETIAKVATAVDSKKPLISPKVAPKARLHVSTRQAIQATLATALASLVGGLISPDRWYWASIAAFMVFVGASRGESLARAFLRTLGTAGGLLVGFLFAYSLSGHTRLEWTLIIACLFFALFGARLAFGFWTSAVFTLMIALLFDIMGTFSKEILFLRLEETFIGSIIGALVAGYVFPSSTHALVKSSLATFMRTASLILDEWTMTTPNLLSRRSLFKTLRQMDRDMKALRLATAPIVGRASPMKSGELPGVLHDIVVLRHYLSHLVMSREIHEGEQIEQLHAHCKRIAEDMRRYADRLELKSGNEFQTQGIDLDKSVPAFTAVFSQKRWLEGVQQTFLNIERRVI